jgi:hypothetical protein
MRREPEVGKHYIFSNANTLSIVNKYNFLVNVVEISDETVIVKYKLLENFGNGNELGYNELGYYTLDYFRNNFSFISRRRVQKMLDEEAIRDIIE